MLEPTTWRPIEVDNTLARWWSAALSCRVSAGLVGRIREEQYGMQAEAATNDVLVLLKLLCQQACIGKGYQAGSSTKRKPLTQILLMLDWEKLFRRDAL